MTATVATSVVVTDLVGSRELVSRLGQAPAEALRAAHFERLRQAVVATGGTEVKDLGDGLMVVYPSLGGALDGAVAMQRGIETHNRRAAEPLAVRIGLARGDATEADGVYYGDPVVEAVGLCAEAQGGQIITTEVVRLLARRTDHRFSSVERIEREELPEPIDACELRWEPLRATAQVPVPGRLAAAPPTGVVGREAERQRLEAAGRRR